MDNDVDEKRSSNMARIRNKNTKPELLLRSALFRMGFRYRLNVKNLVGKPDIVLHKYRTIIFVHGCFWHQHKECKEGRFPKTKQEYWIPKLTKNLVRDEKVKVELEALGWKVFVIWECQLEKKFNETIVDIINCLQ